MLNNCMQSGLKLLRPCKSDKATLHARCTSEGAGVENLQTQTGITRFSGDRAEIIIDFGSARPVDAIALAKTSLSQDAHFVIEASNNSTYLTGIQRPEKYYNDSSKVFEQTKIQQPNTNCNCGSCVELCKWDIEAIGERANPFYSSGLQDVSCNKEECLETSCPNRDLIWIFEQPISSRFFKISLIDEGADHIDAMRLFAGLAWQGDCDVSAGWGVQVVDTSQVRRTNSGLRNCGCGYKYREFSGTWKNASNANELFEWDLAYGKCQELYAIPCVEKCLREQFSFWASPKDTSQITVPFNGRYTKQIELEEVHAWR